MSLPPALGRYRVTGEIGRGAMGVVYRAVDPSLDRPVAVKVISARQASGTLPIEQLEARFMREAKVSARISHPGVVTIFDAGRDGDSLYLVMELVDGQSLADRMSRGEPLSATSSLEVCARVAEALAAAHDLGIVHRDIKPANIMLCRDGGVKVADFGVAKAVGEGTDLTRTGTVVGSPAYMAPEQVRGEALGGRADLFSLGVVLYELLLHRRPFPAETFTTLIYQILNDDPFADERVFSSLGEPTSTFLRACLAKDPAERIADGREFAARARALASGGSGPVAPASMVRTTPSGVVPGASPRDAASAAPTARTPTGGQNSASRSPTGERPRPARRGKPMVLLAVVAGVLLLVAVAAVVFRSRAPSAGSDIGTGEPAPTSLSSDAAAARVPLAPAPAHTAVPRKAAAVSPTPPLAVIPPTVTPIPSPTPTPPIVGVYACRRGAEFNVSPDSADVEINGTRLGIADDWDGKGGGQTYIFRHPGVYYARFSLAGHRTAWVKIVVSPDSDTEIADIDTRLEEVP
jgi:predicted Ser/Thr protein kinase